MGELQLHHVPLLSESVNQNGTRRASKFIQKLSEFKSRLTSRRTKERDGTTHPYPYSRQTRSMDVRADKPFMSQPILGLHNTRNTPESIDGEDSSQSASPSHSFARADPPRENPNGFPPNPGVAYSRASLSTSNLSGLPLGYAAQPQSHIDGLPNPWDPQDPSHTDGLVTVVSRTSPAANSHTNVTPAIVVSSPHSQGPPAAEQPPPVTQSTPPLSYVAQRPNPPADTERSQSRPIVQTTPIIAASPSAGPRERPHSAVPARPAITLNTADATARRSPPPRLPPFLPHRFSASIADKGSARLSPTVITRHPPLPFLHLPTLPLPNKPEDRRDLARRRMRSLKSMPALPRMGSGEGSGTGEGDGEGEGGDEEDDEEDIEEEDEDAEDAGEDEGDAEVVRSSVSTDRSGMISRTESRASSYLTGIEDPDPSPSTRRSSHLRHSITSDSLPFVDTTRFSLSFIDSPPMPISQGKGKQKQSEPDSEATPTATISRSTFPIHESRDYFTSQVSTMSSPSDPAPPSSPRINQHASPPYSPQSTDVSVMPPSPVAPAIDVISPRIEPLASFNKSRPAIYKHASKSLIDVRFGEKRDVQLDAPHPRAKGKETETSTNADPGDSAPTDVDHPSPHKSDAVTTQGHDTIHSLRRQRSMPTFTAATAPPPYPSFAPHPYHPHQPPRPQPREEEGRELLPPYSNSIYLRAIMPCKKEFLTSRVQARDRKWRRVVCVLEGTALKIYRCTPSDAGVGPLGGLWEKAVGVGDVSIGLSGSAVTVQKNGVRRMDEERILKLAGEQQATRDGHTEVVLPPKSEARPPEALRSASPYSQSQAPFSATRSRLNLAVQLLKPSSRPHARSHSDTPAAQARATSPTPPRVSLNIPRGSQGSHSASSGGSRAISPAPSDFSLVSTPSPSSASPFRSSTPVSGRSRTPAQEEEPGELIKAYTMQHAESGIANDYFKRKNVIRFRADGEQFLLQARDVVEVVEWIEGLHSAANVALDLDERVMPRGPLFPRRRRRRGPRRTNTDTEGNPQGGNEPIA